MVNIIVLIGIVSIYRRLSDVVFLVLLLDIFTIQIEKQGPFRSPEFIIDYCALMKR